MASLIEIPDGNPVKFVRTDNAASTKQDYSTRLTHQFVGPLFQYKAAYVAFDQGTSGMFFQIRTNNWYELTLHDVATGEETGDSWSYSVANPTTINDATYPDVDVLNFTIDTSLLAGNYYFQFRFSDDSSGASDAVWKSERFQVGGFDTDNYFYMMWTAAGGQDGLTNAAGTETFAMYIPGRNVKPRLGQDKILSISYDGQISNLRGVPHLYLQLEVSKVPFWVFEKINLASLHTYFYINDVQYQNIDPFDPIVLGGELPITSNYTGKIMFRRVDYQSYADLENVVAPNEYDILYDSLDNSINYGNSDGDTLIWQDE